MNTCHGQRPGRAWRGLATLMLAALLQACGGGSLEGGAGEGAQAVQETGTREQAANVEGAPIYRFAKISTGAYFYTGSQAEADHIRANLPDFRYEGVAFLQSAQAGGTPVYRFANLNNGGYFYTASVAERDATQANYPNMRYEGTTFSVAGPGNQAALQVYRLANLLNGAYLFTSSAAERDYAVSLGYWRYEGSTFSAVPAGPSGNDRWEVRSGVSNCPPTTDSGDGSAGGEGVGAGPGLSMARNMQGRVLKLDGTVLGEAPISDGQISVCPPVGSYRGPYVIEFVAQANAGYFEEAVRLVQAIPEGTRLRVLLPEFDFNQNTGATPFTEAAYQRAIQLHGSLAVLDAGKIRQINEHVRDQVNARFVDQRTDGASARRAVGERLVRSAVGVTAGFSVDDITLLPTLIDENSGNNALDTSPAGRYAALLAALSKAAYAFSGQSLQAPALAFTDHLARDLMDNGQINPEKTVERQTYGLEVQSRVLIELKNAADIWGTPELKVEANPPGLASCSGGRVVSWREGASQCSATVASAQYPHSVSVTLSDTTAPLTGTAQAVCSNGTWVATGSCKGVVVGCAAGAVNWGSGSVQCTASVGAGNAGDTLQVSDLLGAQTGQATAVCEAGAWRATGTCAEQPPCAAGQLGWQAADGTQCSASAPQTASGASVTLRDLTGSTGEATALCNAGSWQVTGRSCMAAAPCAAGTLTWQGANNTVCSASAPQTSSGLSLVLQDLTGTTGEATATCNAGNWQVVPTRCEPQGCAESILNWEVGGRQCSGLAPASSHAQVATVLDTVAPNFGRVTATCSGGIWVQSGRDCSAQPRVVSAAAGEAFSVAVLEDGTLWAWGRMGTTVNGEWVTQVDYGSRPVQIGSGYRAVAAGWYHTLGLRIDGSLWAWGANWYGQLGDGTTTHRWSPVQVGTGYQAVAAGLYHTLGLRADGSLWAWGYNVLGQLGDGTTTDRWSPVQVGTGYQAVAAGVYHTLGLRTNDSLWAWGGNYWYGQLGDGTTTDRPSPVQVGTGYQVVAAGGWHSLGIRNDGSLWAWGANGAGQLGDGTITHRWSPVRVGTSYQMVAAGWDYSLGIRTDGSLWAWGHNEDGQLGDGTTTDRGSPVQIGTGYQAVTAGWYHTLGIRTDGSLWAWGNNDGGQLGNGSVNNSSTPVPVLFSGEVSIFSPPASASALAPDAREQAAWIRAPRLPLPARACQDAAIPHPACGRPARPPLQENSR